MKFTYLGSTVDLSVPNGTGNVAKTINQGRFYEKKMLEYIKELNITGVYLDVGANIGNHSIFFGMFTPATKVISFEPSAKIFSLLQKNIANNKQQDKITAINVAVGDKDGRCSLEVNKSDQIGGARVVEGVDIEEKKLDGLVKDSVSLMKIDVEGFEKKVLVGAKNILKKYKPELFIELATKPEFKEIYDGFLADLGYKPIAVFNNTATYHFSANAKPNKFKYSITKPYAIRRIIRNS